MNYARIYSHLATSSPPAISQFKWKPLSQLQHPDLETFRTQALAPSRPLLIPKAFQLPAAKTWLLPTSVPTLNHSYLSLHADTAFVPMELTHSSAKSPFFQRVSSAPLSLFLAYAALPPAERGERRFYIAQAPLSALPRALQADFATPSLVRESGSGDVYGTSLWIGIDGSYTPLHRDPNPNLLVQVAGKKRVRLMEESEGRSVLERVRRRAGTRVDGGPHVRGEEMMKDERAQLEWEVWENKDAQGFEGTIDANDGVFIPSGWWHAIRGEEEGLNISVRAPFIGFPSN